MTDKKDKKIHVFEVLIFFENILLLSVSRNSSQTLSLVDITLRNFTLSSSAILVKDLIRWNRCFEIFLIDHCAGDIVNKNIAGKYRNIFVSVSSTLYTSGPSSHRLLHLQLLGQCNICIIYPWSMFYFCHSNHSSNIMKNIFNSISIYFWKKISSLTNITNKCVIWKIMYVCKNLLNLDCKDSIRFDICKMKGHLGRVSSSHFLQNVLIETSCVCFKNF